MVILDINNNIRKLNSMVYVNNNTLFINIKYINTMKEDIRG